MKWKFRLKSQFDTYIGGGAAIKGDLVFAGCFSNSPVTSTPSQVAVKSALAYYLKSGVTSYKNIAIAQYAIHRVLLRSDSFFDLTDLSPTTCSTYGHGTSLLVRAPLLRYLPPGEDELLPRNLNERAE
jgi:hypothetical protein